MDGALRHIAQARMRVEHEERSGLLHTATSIIHELRGGLDLRGGGPLAANFDDLYDYLARRLRAARLEGDPEILEEVWHLLHEVRSAWGFLPAYARGQTPAIRE
jgi:flagellar protein FliS